MATSTPPGTPKTRPSILAVDDAEPIRQLLKFYLAASYDLVTAETAEDALAALQSRSFPLVITDVGLPGKSGFELCEDLKKSHPDTMIIVITGLFDMQYAKRAIDAGASGFLTKPIDFKRLQALIADALKHHAHREELRNKRAR
jgi:DNA-binding NtrC family response regulator